MCIITYYYLLFKYIIKFVFKFLNISLKTNFANALTSLVTEAGININWLTYLVFLFKNVRAPLTLMGLEQPTLGFQVGSLVHWAMEVHVQTPA